MCEVTEHTPGSSYNALVSKINIRSLLETITNKHIQAKILFILQWNFGNVHTRQGKRHIRVEEVNGTDESIQNTIRCTRLDSRQVRSVRHEKRHSRIRYVNM